MIIYSLLILSSLLLQVSCDLPWVKPEQLNRGLPSSVEIFTLKTSQSPYGTKLTGGFVRFNMSASNLEFIVKDTNGDALGYFPKTPIQYAQAEQNLVYAVINGGYFDMTKNISSSFLAENGKVKTKNTINEKKPNYPTVGAFGFTTDNKFENEYIYSYGSDFQTYKFRYPNICPGPVINKDLGLPWKVKEGIGAGPILIKDGQIITGNVEQFNQSYMIDTRHPRSAICIDFQERLLFVAIDGRYDESEGLKMDEIADLMQKLNCKEAMNLDGGGSTLLYANHKVINRPSDPTGPRKVVSAVLLRDKYQKKLDSSVKSLRS